MTITRFSKLFLVVLALALWAGTASAQVITASTPSAFAYIYAGAGSNVTTVTSAIGGTGTTDTFSLGTPQYTGANGWSYSGSNGWITSALDGGQGTGTVGDNVTILLNAAAAAAMPAGSYTATILVSDTTDNTSTATINVALTVTSPFSSITGATTATLTSIVGGGSSQATAATTLVFATLDGSAYHTYTATKNTCPAWLTLTSSNAPGNPDAAEAGHNDTLTMKIDPAGAGYAAPANVNGCTVTIAYNGGTTPIKTVTFTNLYIMNQPLTATAASAVLTYNKTTGASGVSTSSTTLSVPASYPSTAANLDLGTVPPWLVASGMINTATWVATVTPVAPATVTFTLQTGVAGGMATGNYVANIGFYVSGLGTEVVIPITLQISSGNVNATVNPATAQNLIYAVGASVPTPSATISATAEPIPYTVACTIVQTPNTYVVNAAYGTTGCSLTGTAAPSNTVSGTAFTWGSTVNATLDPALFSVSVGYTVQVILTYSGTPLAQQPVVSYTYTVQPGPAAFATSSATTVGAALNPASISARGFAAGSSFNVLVRGSGFIGPKDIVGSAVEQTQVFLGTTQLDLPANAAAGSYVVMDHNDIMITIPASSVPTVTAGHTATLNIGLANQTGTTAPTAAAVTSPLTFTYAPVVYSVTSTATYAQPALNADTNHLGYVPVLAPYDLISIFGDNFGFTGSNLSVTYASNTLDSYGKYLSPMTLGTPTGTGAKPVTLSVTFKDPTLTKNNTWTAPIIFANQNQINAIVPSGLTVGTYYEVIVNTSVAGTAASSDGTYATVIATADPGVFTLSSDGVGQGAIVNQNGSINGAAAVGNTDQITIYLAGLGAPDSAGGDVVPSSAITVPAACIAINQASPAGLLQVVNTKVGTTYASPGWTTIDGAVLSYDSHHIVEANPMVAGQVNYPPCFATATITVTIGTATDHVTMQGIAGSVAIPYAGFVGGSVAGLYQINAQLPNLSTAANWGPTTTQLHGLQPLTVTIAPTSGPAFTSPAVKILLP